jgi:predicted metal-dependent enzyme (double-stranded beta helix superfamily)
VDIEELVAQCSEAVEEPEWHSAVRLVLERAVGDRRLVESLVGPACGLNTLFVSPGLTVLNVVWPPCMSLYPHNHRMWAAIGIYRGREDNSFYRRQGDVIVEAGGRTLDQGDVFLLGDDAIHAVHNPISGYTGAIHVYGGDFFATPRSQWDFETLQEQPYDVEATRREFERAERNVDANLK